MQVANALVNCLRATNVHLKGNASRQVLRNDFITMRLLDAIFATLKSIVDDDIFSDIVVMWHSLINSEEVTQFRVMCRRVMTFRRQLKAVVFRPLLSS